MIEDQKGVEGRMKNEGLRWLYWLCVQKRFGVEGIMYLYRIALSLCVLFLGFRLIF